MRERMSEADSVTVQITLTEDWVSRIADAVVRRIGTIEPRKNDTDTIYDVKGLASYLHVDENWIYQRRASRRSPLSRRGNIVCSGISYRCLA